MKRNLSRNESVARSSNEFHNCTMLKVNEVINKLLQAITRTKGVLRPERRLECFCVNLLRVLSSPSKEFSGQTKARDEFSLK